MTNPSVPTHAPDAADAPALGTVLIRYPNLFGALVTVRVADYPKGSANISAAPHLNRYAECAGCGATRASVERGVQIDQAREWAQTHSEKCRALPPEA
jgi:hypothetical protein